MQIVQATVIQLVVIDDDFGHARNVEEWASGCIDVASKKAGLAVWHCTLVDVCRRLVDLQQCSVLWARSHGHNVAELGWIVET
eukprot:6074859-Prymnesium_polylepis.2